MRVIRWLATILGVAIAGTALFAIATRFADGPVAVLPGGELVAGAWVEAPVADWGFVADVEEVELQLLEPLRSRTVWILLEDGRAYIPCGAPDFKLWKQWPHEALEDGRSVIRIEGKRYPIALTRTDDPELSRNLQENIRAKYPASAGYEGDVWFFELSSRSDRGEST